MLLIRNWFYDKLGIELFNWYGWTNPNTSLLSYFNSAFLGRTGKNLGFDLFPLVFWKHFFLECFEIGADNKRISIGLGFFSIFWDHTPRKK